MSPELPITAVLPALAQTLAAAPAVVLQAPPGAGKSTGVPLALLDAPWLAGRRIVMLEPRRLAARAVAARMSALLGEPPGATVGYRVRFEARVSARTRIEVVTEGILTRRLQSDPELAGVGLLIFDEFHERSLHADLALALARDAQLGLREDLKLLLMSATLDGERLCRLLDDAPLVSSEGRAHPVAIRHVAREPEAPLPEALAQQVVRLLAEESGDVLAFLPGGAEIRRAAERLRTLAPQVSVLPLYGELPAAEQQRALEPAPDGRRRVVLATTIAETSLTIDGIRLVVDGGWTRAPRFDAASGLTRLATVRVSRAAAAQRAGRAGRLGPGLCLRLWTAATDSTLAPFSAPEILEADLAPLALELAAWGAAAGALVWLDPPNPGALAQAQELLRGLDALDADARITAQGRALLALGLHPRLGHLLLRGRALGLGALACDLAALLDERDPLRGEAARSADLTLRLEALAAVRAGAREAARGFGADASACARLLEAARVLRERLDVPAADPRASIRSQDLALLVAAAYPDRIARRRDGSPDRFLLASGRGARLREGDALTGSDWLAVAALDAGEREGRIFLAVALDLPTLETALAGHIAEVAEVRWDEREQAVVARRERRLGALLLDARALARPEPAALRRAMCAGIERLGLDALPWTDGLRDWQKRVQSLRHWQPEAGWPEVSDAALAATLGDWLQPYLDGCTRREHLARLDLAAILHARLDWPQTQRLAALAPTHLDVPSGSRLRLEYAADGAAPVLAVKLQEMFGLADTPRIADGRIAVTLHLLSPARRPIQVTQDLRGFWERTYAEVRKELKGRYPKHPWPDDPWTAVPTARAKPRGR